MASRIHVNFVIWSPYTVYIYLPFENILTNIGHTVLCIYRSKDRSLPADSDGIKVLKNLKSDVTES